MTPDNLEDLRKLAEAATPGPYIQNGRNVNSTGTWSSRGRTYIARVGSEPFKFHTRPTQEQCLANAAFIAACDPSTILALIERVRAAEGKL